jgi:hypothetical protein
MFSIGLGIFANEFDPKQEDGSSPTVEVVRQGIENADKALNSLQATIDSRQKKLSEISTNLQKSEALNKISDTEKQALRDFFGQELKSYPFKSALWSGLFWTALGVFLDRLLAMLRLRERWRLHSGRTDAGKAS